MSVTAEIAAAHRAGRDAFDAAPRGQAPTCPYNGHLGDTRERVLARAWRAGVLSRVDPALRQQ